MAQNLVINGVTYNGVESISMTNKSGGKVEYIAAADIPRWFTKKRQAIQPAAFVIIPAFDKTDKIPLWRREVPHRCRVPRICRP